MGRGQWWGVWAAVSKIVTAATKMESHQLSRGGGTSGEATEELGRLNWRGEATEEGWQLGRDKGCKGWQLK